MKKIPQTADTSMSMDILQSLISSRIGWSQQQAFDFQIDAGYFFLHYIVGKLSDKGMKAALYSKFFWNWWRNAWYMRDQKLYMVKLLDDHHYVYMNTTDLHNDAQLLKSFWSHSDKIMNVSGKSRTVSKETEVSA